MGNLPEQKLLQNSWIVKLSVHNSETDNCKTSFYLQRGASNKRLAATWTGMLGPAGWLVQLLVCAPMAALCELSPTVRARIGSLSCVNAPMLYQQLAPGKAFSAVLTFVALRDWSRLRRLVQHACNPVLWLYSYQSLGVLYKMKSTTYATVVSPFVT